MKNLDIKLANLYLICVKAQEELIIWHDHFMEEDTRHALIIDTIKSVLNAYVKAKEELFHMIRIYNRSRLGMYIPEEETSVSVYPQLLKDFINEIKFHLHLIDYVLHLTNKQFEDIKPSKEIIATIKKIQTELNEIEE